MPVNYDPYGFDSFDTMFGIVFVIIAVGFVYRAGFSRHREKLIKWKPEQWTMEKLNYEVGDIVKLKKPHPCGSNEWEILRVGADFRLKCMGCGHQIMVARRLVEKNTRGLAKKTE